MKKNIGKRDQTFRLVIGLLLVALAISGFPFGWIGVIFILTAAANFCPLYTLLRMETCSLDVKDSKGKK